MPRSNRPRRPKSSRPGNARNHDEESDYEAGSDDWLQKARFGVVRLQDAPDGQWHVRKIAPMNASKTYTCPGCNRQIGVGVGHLVAWRADHWSGEDAAATARRHWHSHCWDTRSYRY